MLRSVLPPFACLFLFLVLALVIQLGLWKGKGILAIADPYNVSALVAALSLLTWRLFVGSEGSTIKNFSIFLFTDHHGFF